MSTKNIVILAVGVVAVAWLYNNYRKTHAAPKRTTTTGKTTTGNQFTTGDMTTAGDEYTTGNTTTSGNMFTTG